MIPAAGPMKPLPVRPIEPVTRMLAPLHVERTTRTVHPLPVPTPEPVEMIDAIRDAALQRLLDRLSVQQPG
jgi:hypothetical protein